MKSKIIKSIYFVFSKFMEDNGFRKASSLAYATIFSITPIFTLIISISTMIYSGKESQNLVLKTIFSFILPKEAGDLEKFIISSAKNISSLNSISAAFFLFGGIFLFITIENILNSIWRVSNKKNIIRAFINYWALITIFPIFFGASFYITSKYFIDYIKLTHLNMIFVSLFISIFINTILFSITYYLMPNVKIHFKSALIGAIFFSIFYEIIKSLFSLFIKNSVYQSIYGALSVFLVFIFWIYLVWIIFIIGAEISYLVQNPEQIESKGQLKNFEFLEYLTLYLIICDNYLKDNHIDIELLQKYFQNHTYIELFNTLNFLINKNLIIYTDIRGYIPYKDLNNIKISEIIANILDFNNIKNYFYTNDNTSSKFRSLSEKLISNINTTFNTTVYDFLKKENQL